MLRIIPLFTDIAMMHQKNIVQRRKKTDQISRKRLTFFTFIISFTAAEQTEEELQLEIEKVIVILFLLKVIAHYSLYRALFNCR